MLTYTFSRREKALLLVFAIILVLIAWFVFVYQRTGNEAMRIDSEIATVQSEIQVNQVRVDQLDNMRNAIAAHKSAGVAPITVPAYDNMQRLMSELNGVMKAAQTYKLSFDELDLTSTDVIGRGVRIDYGTSTYKSAEKIVEALAKGTYPCRIDSVSIVDSTKTKKSRRTSTGSPVNSSVHVTFFETYPADGSIVPQPEDK